MAERAVPMPIQIRDALLLELKKIGIDDETKWRSRPKHALVAAGSLQDMVNGPRPAIYITTGKRATQSWTADLHRDTLQIFVYCVSENPRDAEAALWDLMSDVERAIRESFKLAGVLDSGLIDQVDSEPKPEAAAGQNGVGFGIVTAEAYYQTTDTDP